MAASTSTTKRSASPCGCGGSSHAKTSTCSCGGSCGCTCSTCQTEGYSRPRFFAGQLLTEDDLQQLGDYVVGKNRLHASHLFGSGVVCGLEVTCFPCGGGKVIVNPGYALDCCGNDIVLTCPQELDINQMVRELQRKMRGGFDCGDPCADAQQAPAQQASQASGSSETGQVAGMVRGRQTTVDEPKPVAPHHKYCLYVDYCEQPSDPVSPYATDDPCTSQTCETTRVREGFRFELRCPDYSEPVPPICSRYHDCLGDPVALTKTQHDAAFLQPYGKRIAVALAAIQKSPAGPTFDPKQFLPQLSGDIQTLNELHARISKDPQKISSADAQAFVDAAVSVGSDVARYSFHHPWQQIKSTVGEFDESIEKEIEAARGLLRPALSGIQAMLKGNTPAPFDTQLAKDYATSFLDLAQPVLDTRSLSPTAAPISKDTLRMYIEGAVVTLGIYKSATSSLSDLRAFLVSRLEQEAMKTHCCLLDSVIAAPEPQAVYNGDPEITHVYMLRRVSDVLTTTLGRLVQACLCNALNPPCPSCDDPGVLLACITLEDCKVKDICNLDRQFVLSPVAIRYWISEITRIGRAIEKACCPDPCADEGSSNIPSRIGSYAGTDPDLAYASLFARLLVLGCEESSTSRFPISNQIFRTSATQLAGNIRALDLSSGPLPRPAQAAGAASVVAEAEGAPSASDLAAKLRKTQSDHEKLRAEFSRLSDKLKGLEKKIEK